MGQSEKLRPKHKHQHQGYNSTSVSIPTRYVSHRGHISCFLTVAFLIQVAPVQGLYCVLQLQHTNSDELCLQLELATEFELIQQEVSQSQSARLI